MTHTDKRLLTQVALLAACVSVTGLAHAQSHRAAITKPVAGPVTLHLNSISADLRIRTSAAKTIALTASGLHESKVTLVQKGNDYHVRFDGDNSVREGKVSVTVPAGSSVRVNTVSGSVQLRDVANARVRSVSGDVKLDGANTVEIASVSGDLKLRKIAGDVTAKTVSGDIKIVTTGNAASKLRTSTTSGDLDWSGRCGKGCAMRLNTLSGRLHLRLDKASSFTLRHSSFSGGLKDGLGLSKSSTSGRATRASYGGGAGAIKARSFSGRLELDKK